MKKMNDNRCPLNSRMLHRSINITQLTKMLVRKFMLMRSEVFSIPLEENNAALLSIINQNSNSIVVTDVHKSIVFVNEAFEKISGFKKSEVLGKNPRILKSDKTPLNVFKSLNKSVENDQKWTGEFTNKHANGEEYIEEATISSIKNIGGDTIFYLAEKRDITNLRVAESYADKLTKFDSLTELPNRQHFFDRAELMTLAHIPDDKVFSILLIDLNRFKEFNDAYGYDIGDTALQIVSNRIECVLSPNDFFARMGGDEFGILHQDGASLNTAQDLAISIVDCFEKTFLIEGQEHSLNVSIGIATWSEDISDLRELLAHSDLAMQYAKTSAEHYILYTRKLGRDHVRQFDLSKKLSHAIARNEFHLVYQPKIELNSNKIVGLEALIRWTDLEYGVISPVEFIPIAEKYQMMTEIGEWVIERACRQINQWKAQGVPLFGRMALNISIQQLEQQSFHQSLLTIITKEGVDSSMFELEVTESVLITDPDKIMSTLASLIDSGFSIAIDDFGTGYSSLSYLKQLKASVLKIDKSFIDNMETDENDRLIVKSIIDLAHNLEMQVVAEGVETVGQLKQLVSRNCDMVQGYYFSKPISGDEMLNCVCGLENKVL